MRQRRDVRRNKSPTVYVQSGKNTKRNKSLLTKQQLESEAGRVCGGGGGEKLKKSRD